MFAAVPSQFQWLVDLFTSHDHALAVAHAVLILSLSIAVGLGLGSIRVFKISLGIAGVLFSALAFSHFGLSIDEGILEFARDFGLILFVYTIGLQVGPGFLGSLRRAGLPLNLMAAAIVLLGVGTTLGVVFVSKEIGRPIDMPTAVGLMAGGTTNTPSLAAAQQAVKESAAGSTTAPENIAATADAAASKAVRGYAVAYPFGVVGIILSMILLRTVFKINVTKENEHLASENLSGNTLKGVNLLVSNLNLNNRKLGDISQLSESGVVISRIMHNGISAVAQPESIIHFGDTLHAVGPAEKLEDLKLLIGGESKMDLKAITSGITTRSIVVTRPAVIGKTIEELNALGRFDVSITRTSRAEVEIAATSGWRLQFGDIILAVGHPDALSRMAEEMGDSRKRLEHPQFIGVFVGIALGVAIGSVPVWFPGIPAPVRLGLAGGPLVVALLLSRFGQIGPLTWYMPRGMNYALRELGIALFLACVGLKAGHGFMATLAGDGLYWMLCAALITALPLLTVGFFARRFLKLNFVTLCGLLAGSMTDPPALQFANQISDGESPSVAYATVYPLTMLLRIIAAQMLILFFWKP